MSRASRVAIVLAAIAIAVVAFVVLQGEDDENGDDGPAVTTTTTPAGEGQRGTGDGPEKPDTPERPAEPKVPTIVVQNGEVVGGVAELEFTKGERIRFKVRSDVADHVHLHGYDAFQDVPAGGEITFDVPATLDGVFEVELEDRVIPLAEITVNPG